MFLVRALFLVSAFALIFAKQVKVTVFYESLCPYSIEYLVNQAIPGYKKLSENIQLDLVPYGNARTVNKSGTLTFICQHGEGECKGNRYHGCVLDLYPIDIASSYIACDLAADDPSGDRALEKCAQETNVLWNDLKTCVNSPRSDEIMAKYGERTNSAQPEIQGVPTTFFNDVYDEDLNDDAYTSFVTVVCSLLDNEPAACMKLNVK